MSQKRQPGCTCGRHRNKGFPKGIDARTGLPTRDPLERFMEKVERRPAPDGVDGDCLMWTAGTRGGNAQFWDGERMAYGHIWIYRRMRGPVAPGHDLHHRCERHLCMNVDHMVALAHSEHSRTPHTKRVLFEKGSTIGHRFQKGNVPWNTGKPHLANRDRDELGRLV